MKVLILGGTGMLGHKLWQTCAPRFDTYATVRLSAQASDRAGIFDGSRLLGDVSVEKLASVAQAVDRVQPDVVINGIGIVKQHRAGGDPLTNIAINALFPHRLAQLCGAAGIRLIHVSTDCVFSGRKGHYVESDTPDADDLYGRSKLLGEVDRGNCLTLRASMIGRELRGAHGLLEWFLGQEGKTVRGFTRARFSGFTTAALASVIGDIIADHQTLRGVWHVAADPISKFDVLSLVRDTFGLDVEIEPDDTVVCDRSLAADRFRQATGFAPRPWPDMIDRMAKDPTPYEEIRRPHAG
jgi:dTDP-4-dehydrorhamnose reductase